MALEIALISLGTVAVRTATKLWLGDHKIAAEVTASAVDVLSGRLSKQIDKRKFGRMIENFSEAVVERVEPIIESEFRNLAENERLAAIDAVRDTFEQAPLVDADLFAADLDARHLDRSIRKQVPNQSRLLSSDATELYDLLLRECCGYIIEISRGLPQFSSGALTELLRRDREILDGIRQVLARLPQRDRNTDFDYDYRQLVARKLDRVEMYGVTLEDASRQYPLSVAYISLSASSNDEVDDAEPTSRIEFLLARSRRLFIRGEAGLGKTTLLHWMAVRSALRDFPEALDDWNDTIPFFIALRQYSDRQLPAPENFLDGVGRHISDEMPKGWVQQCLREGRAVVLVDGVDELSVNRRNEVKTWLGDLVDAFPEARFVITSRPGAAQSKWLKSDDFSALDLQPMNPRDVMIFVERWHTAMKLGCADIEAQSEIDSYQDGLVAQLNARTHLRKLAGYPLLCALLCALHRDRRAALPSSRMELYDVALQMLLERRDNERVITKLAGLERTESVLILGEFAYWLIRNGYSDTDVSQAIQQISNKLTAMPQIKASPEVVYQVLLERSGLLREPIDGRVDFVHRTFQEYLAAGTLTGDANDIGALVKNAHLDQWHEVVVMAVGHASRSQREALFNGLLQRAASEPKNRDSLNLLALASLETAPELSPQIRQKIHTRAASLLPPKTFTTAKSFASAGEFVLDLLANAEPRTARETAATIRAIVDTGSPEAINLIRRYANDNRRGVQNELVSNWSKFDVEQYAQVILPSVPIHTFTVSCEADMRAFRHLSRVYSGRIFLDGSWNLDMSLIPKDISRLSMNTFRSGLPLDVTKLENRKWHTDTKWHIDASPMAEMKRLESFSVDGLVLSNFNHVTFSSKLRELRLTPSPSVKEIARISPGLSLTILALSDLPDLVDLAPIESLRMLRSLSLENMPNLRSVEILKKWADQLTALTIIGCPEIGLEQLSSLKNLRILAVHKKDIKDLTPLADMQNLRQLGIPFNLDDEEIFRPLAHLSDLRIQRLDERRLMSRGIYKIVDNKLQNFR